MAAPRKGPDAFRTISEASAELGVPQHVLRFWETKFGFIQPLKRAGGRRFYRSNDLDVLRGVRALLHDEGYTIKGVQRLHKDGGLRRLVSAGGDARDLGEDPVSAEEPLMRSDAAPGDEGVAPRRAAHRDERSSRHVLDAASRLRLSEVLRDLETARAAIDALLT